jgi:hypothetical protein
VNGKCGMCGEPTQFVFKVDGEETPLCRQHQEAWEKWGALAGMIAFLVRRANRPWASKVCEAYGDHDWNGERFCRRCGGVR